MHGRQYGTQLRADLADPVGVQWPVRGEQVAEAATAHQPHHQIGPAVFPSGTEHGRHPGVRHARQRRSLRVQQVRRLLVRHTPRGPRELDGDVATEQPVPALPHVTPDATCQWHPAEFVTLVVHECYRIVWRGIVASATSLNPTTTKVLDCAAWNPPIRRCHYPGPWPYARSMTTADDPHPRREQEPRRERLRRRAATISGVTTSLLLTMAVGGTIARDTGRALLPGWLSSFGVALGFVVTVAIIWRHQYPGLLTGFALLPPVLAGPSLPALIALAALAASRRD